MLMSYIHHIKKEYTPEQRNMLNARLGHILNGADLHKSTGVPNNSDDWLCSIVVSSATGTPTWTAAVVDVISYTVFERWNHPLWEQSAAVPSDETCQNSLLQAAASHLVQFAANLHSYVSANSGLDHYQIVLISHFCNIYSMCSFAMHSKYGNVWLTIGN